MADASIATDNAAAGVAAMLPDDVHREIFFRLPARHLSAAPAPCAGRGATSPRIPASSAPMPPAPPLLLTWSDTVTERDGVRDCTVHLRIHQDHDAGGRSESAGDDGHGRGGSRCCDLRLVLTARYASTSGAMRSWDGILFLCAEMWVRPPAFAEHVPSSYLLLNPITRACAVASAPALRAGGGGSDRGYVAGAYSHPVTGVFHLLHSSGSANEQAPRFRVLTVGSLDATWREVPVPGDADTAALQAAVGRLRLQSSATAHGRLHWRVAARSSSETNRRRHGKEVELLVFDARTEEFGRMALPELHHHEAVMQRAISALSGKLRLLAGLASPPAAVEVWVLEEYDARDSRLLDGEPVQIRLLATLM